MRPVFDQRPRWWDHAVMSDSDHHIPENETLRDEALAWLRRLNSGEATPADVAALDKCRARSARHSHAFAEAALLWNVLGEATRQAVASNPALGVTAPDRNMHLARRALLAGSGALAASVAAGGLIIRPPLDLWPSFSEFAADYRTQTGERQQFEVAGHVS